MDITGQEPTAIGLFAVHSHTMSSELRRFPDSAPGHGQVVPASRVSDMADNHGFFQLADATDPHPVVGVLKGDGEFIPTKRLLPRTHKHDIIRHECEQASKIAGVDGIDPG